ncbi:MAG: phage portal protein, partial [Stackebrandtia sp.]
MPPTSSASRLAAELLGELRDESQRLDKVDRYVRGEHDGPYVPRTASREYKLLAERAVTNLLPLISGSIAQVLFVDGFRHSDGSTAAGWRWWQHNGLDARQSGVHRAMLDYGLAYVTVLPGDALDGGGRAPVIRGVSPRRMHARFHDPAEDEWPVHAIRAEPITLDGEPRLKIRLYDAVTIVEFHAESDGSKLVEVERVEHGAGVCPVVAFRDCPDLEGRSRGEVEPHIATQDRLNQTIFDLLVAQSFSSFKVRTVTGMTPETDADGKPRPMP